MKKILVPVDGSEHGCKAVSWAATLAAEVGAQMTLLFVHDLPAAEVMGLASKSRTEISAIEEAHAQPVFEAAQACLDDIAVGVGGENRTVIGDPREEIVGLAKREAFDHIVIGSRGLSPISELLMGSVSEHVMRKAHCPVTVIR